MMWSYSLEYSGDSPYNNIVALMEDDCVGFVADYLIPSVEENNLRNVVFRQLEINYPADDYPNTAVIMHGKASGKVARWVVLRGDSTCNFIVCIAGKRSVFTKNTTGRLHYKKQSFKLAVKSVSNEYMIDHTLSTVFFDKEWYIGFETSEDYVQASLEQ